MRRTHLLLLSAFLVACGESSSEDPPGSTANNGGAAGKGGSAGSSAGQGGIAGNNSAGTSSQGGTGGQSGAAGQGGASQGGSTAGGQGGESGTSGQGGNPAGSGGSAGTSSNAGAGGAGTSGAGGSDAGAGGSGAGQGGSGGSGGAVLPSTHPRIYLNEANKTRLKAALVAKTKSADRFKTMVDLQLGGSDIYDFQAWFAALVYGLTGETKYCTYAINQIDQQVTDEEALIQAGQRADVAGDSYLYVGDRIGDLALTYDWCNSQLTASQKKRWVDYANQAVWNVWHNEDASWGGVSYPWSGWSVDNPVNNYYFSFLRATMLLGAATKGENDQADGWITRFRQDKIAQQLVPIYTSDLPGGGSREGTGYGVAMAGLFHLYDLWESTTGESIDQLTPHARESIAHMMHSVVPTRDRIAPIGDHARDSTAALFDYHRNYLQQLATLYPSEPITEIVRGFLPTTSVTEMSQYFMRYSDFMNDTTGLPTRPISELYPVYYAPGVGHLFARSGWETSSTWLSLIAGPYTESHAHRDQGSLLIYKREWLAYDANIDSHSGLRQEEEAHNLVRIESGGKVIRMVAESSPTKLLALHDEPSYLHTAADITPVYKGKAPIQKVERELVYLKPDIVVVMDRVATSDPNALRVFQLNAPVAPVVNGATTTINGAKTKLEVTRILPQDATSKVFSWPAIDSDVLAGHRLDVTASGAAVVRFLHVFSLDGAAQSVTASNQGNLLGVSVTLAGGSTAIVRFDPDKSGGTISISGGSGPQVDAPLGTVVDKLPVMVQ